MKPRILVVDDEESIRTFLDIMLKKEGYEVTLAEDGEHAIDILSKKTFDLVISDLQMPKKTGIELLQFARQNYPQVHFMMITAFGTLEGAVEAMKMGAHDYLTKPFKLDEIRLSISHVLRSQYLEKENVQLKNQLKVANHFQNLIGNSSAMAGIIDLIKKVSQAPTNVLITGESGTGKEMVAKAIHYNGPLKEKPFVTINCGAIPEQLMESEMFGHKKGSFTSAVNDKVGLFEVADGGTLFLDEVGELPMSIQVKLLRALQERIIRRVGATEDIKVDVRIMAATNRNLDEMVKKGTFRQDLYYRLNVINIKVPALRDRPEDIPILADHFLRKYSEKLGRPPQTLSNETLEQLQKYRYPGNVRELENLIERSVALESGSVLMPESLPPLVQTAGGSTKLASAQDIVVGAEGLDLDKVMGQIEKEILVKAIHAAGGVKKRAARLLKISFRSMRYRVEKYGLGVMSDDELDGEESA